MSDGTCVIFENGQAKHLEVSLPLNLLYHGKTYVLSVSSGARRGLIMTKALPAPEKSLESRST